ncbi:MAG: hypothetical protein K2I25_06465, partial [Muribaculaceae bacterium]|nr:hypothetical protein [Muribaculaceae bacterium]
MNRLLISLLLLCMGIATVSGVSITKKDVENSLDMLDKEIAKRSDYIHSRETRIDSIRQRLAEPIPDQRQLDLTMQLGDLYSSFNNDSALIAYTRGLDKAREIGDSVNVFRFRVKRATILPLSGFVMEANKEFESIDTSGLSHDDLVFYYTSARQMYSYITSFFINYPESRNRWNSKASAYRDSLLSVLDPKSLTYDLNYSEELIANDDFKRAKVVLLELLDHISPNSNLYARACHLLAIIAREKGNTDEETYYLALSAMADIKGAVREVMSLQELGVIMSENNDIDRAYDYLSVALTNAV